MPNLKKEYFGSAVLSWGTHKDGTTATISFDTSDAKKKLLLLLLSWQDLQGCRFAKWVKQLTRSSFSIKKQQPRVVEGSSNQQLIKSDWSIDIFCGNASFLLFILVKQMAYTYYYGHNIFLQSVYKLG